MAPPIGASAKGQQGDVGAWAYDSVLVEAGYRE
jgi:hypothetical protein